jgi:uncharacterized membrane protein (DUF106 family)
MQYTMRLKQDMDIKNNNMITIDFKPLIRTLLSILLIGVAFYTIVNNTKYSIPNIQMYTPPADTVIITPPVLSFK